MDYPCAKFGDFSFSRFFVFRAEKHTRTEIERIADATKRFTSRRVISAYHCHRLEQIIPHKRY